MYDFRSALCDLRLGLTLALVTLLTGFALGGAFGGAEARMRQILADRGSTVIATVYQGDAAAFEAAQERAWTFFRRAHLHAGGMATSALTLIAVLAVIPHAARLRRAAAAALGLGGLGYTIFLLLAALRTPALGDAHAAKESLAWLAIPSAGLYLLGALTAAVLFVRFAFKREPSAASPTRAIHPFAHPAPH
jgi:hypothetical protein